MDGSQISANRFYFFLYQLFSRLKISSFFMTFFMWATFKVFIEFVKNIASGLCFGFLATRLVGS